MLSHGLFGLVTCDPQLGFLHSLSPRDLNTDLLILLPTNSNLPMQSSYLGSSPVVLRLHRTAPTSTPDATGHRSRARKNGGFATPRQLVNVDFVVMSVKVEPKGSHSGAGMEWHGRGVSRGVSRCDMYLQRGTAWSLTKGSLCSGF